MVTSVRARGEAKWTGWRSLVWRAARSSPGVARARSAGPCLAAWATSGVGAEERGGERWLGRLVLGEDFGVWACFPSSNSFLISKSYFYSISKENNNII